ncbi:uncharacterized protein [Drosophila kikkawai]|uniref:Uncharacterized protein n=1 Tax=Drosophila kikkawai TaxID=30033 RepID=A0A6P4J679_DROKI|nr:classical arabinogalactan protein 4 [Drosophila kikkawai]
MSPRRDIFVALSCCCLVLSFLGIQARNLQETAVSKRDISDWFSYFDDLLYDSDSDEDTKKILVCSNCTVVVQPVPAGGAAPGSTGSTDTTASAKPAAAPIPAPAVTPGGQSPSSASPVSASSPVPGAPGAAPAEPVAAPPAAPPVAPPAAPPAADPAPAPSA